MLRATSDWVEPCGDHPLGRVESVRMATDTDILPRLLTVDEVCELLHYSRSTVYRLIGAGNLPAVRLGRDGAALRVRTDALADWLAPITSERTPTR